MSEQTYETRGLFVIGTDTDVGKTYVTAQIARATDRGGVKVGAYKPACSGAEIDESGKLYWHDLNELSQAIGGLFPHERIAPQCFGEPLAPPVAARLAGTEVDARLLRSGVDWWRGRVELLLVEGVGGLLCPLAESETIADLAADLGFPLLVVARLGLGTINHTLLTIEVAQRRGLRLAGLILNEGPTEVSAREAETNPQEIAAYCDVPLLGIVRRDQPSLLFRQGEPIDVDWLALASGEK